MSGTLKTVRFKVSWQTYRVGDEIVPHGLLRDWLMANGYVEIVADSGPVRPARLSARAAKTIADSQKSIL
jgi:hypothetical protein